MGFEPISVSPSKTWLFQEQYQKCHDRRGTDNQLIKYSYLMAFFAL